MDAQEELERTVSSAECKEIISKGLLRSDSEYVPSLIEFSKSDWWRAEN